MCSQIHMNCTEHWDSTCARHAVLPLFPFNSAATYTREVFSAAAQKRTLMSDLDAQQLVKKSVLLTA
jgi:hypothetical protein